MKKVLNQLVMNNYGNILTKSKSNSVMNWISFWKKNQCGFWPTLTIKDENGGLTAMMTLVLLSRVFWRYKCSLFLQVCQKLMKKLQAYSSSPSRSMYLQKCSNGWIVTLFLGDILTTTATKLNTKRWTMMAGWSFFQNNPVLSYS